VHLAERVDLVQGRKEELAQHLLHSVRQQFRAIGRSLEVRVLLALAIYLGGCSR